MANCQDASDSDAKERERSRFRNTGSGRAGRAASARESGSSQQ